MNSADMLPHLERWKHEMDSSVKVCDTYLDPLKLSPESPVYSCIWSLQDALTATVSRLVGDQDAWLSWYANDNDMGAAGRVAMIKGKHRKIRTLKALARAIVDTRDQ